MSIKTFMYFNGSEVKGETSDKDMKDKGAFELTSFELGAENNIDIGSLSSGGGAGKAVFKELTIYKRADTSSCALFLKLVEGAHFDDATIEVRNDSGKTFMKMEFKLVMVQDVSWTGYDGDDVCEEMVVMRYGAMKVTYTKHKKDGKAGKSETAEWSQVLNKANFAVS